VSPWTTPELEREARRLGPYARDTLERAVQLAARLHAREISPEHWLAALMDDEECAATRAVLHAFADPETLGVEILALCEGIMVVGSKRTLPFSVRGVEALEGARKDASARGSETVEPGDVFWAAVDRLGPALSTRLSQVPGVRLLRPEPVDAHGFVPPGGPLFRSYSPSALRSLGASVRAAAGLERSAIGPAHLAIGALEVDEALRERTSLTPARVRMAGTGLDEDSTPLPERRLGGDARLRAMLADLPENGETLDVLGWILTRGSEELIALLRRQKVTSALFERCRGVYQDPDCARPD